MIFIFKLFDEVFSVNFMMEHVSLIVLCRMMSFQKYNKIFKNLKIYGEFLICEKCYVYLYSCIRILYIVKKYQMHNHKYSNSIYITIYI